MVTSTHLVCSKPRQEQRTSLGHQEPSPASPKSMHSPLQRHTLQPFSSIFLFKQRQHCHRRGYDSDKAGLKFRSKLLFPSARQLCTRNTACKHFFVKHSITSCFMNKTSQQQRKQETKPGKQWKLARVPTPPRPRPALVRAAAPLTGQHGHVGKTLTAAFQNGAQVVWI